MTIISCLQYTLVSGLPTAAEKLDHGREADGYKTDWKNSPTADRKTRGNGYKSYSRAQLIRMLNELGGAKGGVSHGGYNRRYMAFTQKEASIFPSLLSTEDVTSQNVPSISRRAINASCSSTYKGMKRMCNECSIVTFLGNDRIPSYINEVTCGHQTFCNNNFVKLGVVAFTQCENVAVFQTFLLRTGKHHPITNYEILQPYTQKIRASCQCMVIN